LSLGEINKYVNDVQAVGSADVQKFASTTLTGNAASIVIAGDVKKFGDDFRKRFPDAEVIPLAQLDLDSPTLRKQ
jgi:zinc protease